MDPWVIVVSGTGLLIVVLVVVDVILTVLHVDSDGPIVSILFRAIWRVLAVASRLVPAARATLLALAGPGMIVAAVTVWFGLYVLGFALVYWPFMELFRADEEHALLGFTEAIYFSGVTATVLGHGDISPTEGFLQIGSFIQAGMGFGLLTGIVSYVINVTSGVMDRNTFELRLWIATGETGDGARAVSRLLAVGGRSAAARLWAVVDSAERVHLRMRRFPLLDLFYRSTDPVFAPELMIQTLSRMAIAAGVACTDPRHRALRPAAAELAAITRRTTDLVARKHLDRSTRERLRHPDPTAEDRRTIAEIGSMLGSAGTAFRLDDDTDAASWLGLACRTRILLEALGQVTGWRPSD